jgi:hypothetical protein
LHCDGTPFCLRSSPELKHPFISYSRELFSLESRI